LKKITDEEMGVKHVIIVVKWENVEEYLDFPKERVGGIIVANKAGYGWNEEMTQSKNTFSIPPKTRYKPAILPENAECMWIPFMIAGPKVRKNYKINGTIHLQDEFPTIMYLINKKSNNDVDGKIIKEILMQ